jgi:hypothetical protein
MHKYRAHKAWIPALLLAVVMAAGCGDTEKSPNPGNPGDPLTPPTVTAVTPLDVSIVACPSTALITATFSKPMNPATITVSTFTLTSAGASVSGQVTYGTATNTATFAPSSGLAASAPLTATITTGAASSTGIHLASNFVWNFTTSSACPPPPAAIALGAACTFGMLGATPSVTSTGPTTVTGDIGVFPGASIVGFPPGTLTGVKHPGDSIAQTAQGDLTIAYNNAAGAAGGAVLPADAGGLTLAPGVYKTTSAQPTLGITGNLTLSGPASGVWIFQIVSALTTATGNSQVIMSGGATAHNVFWVIGSSATLGTNTTFAGTIMAHASITVTTGATLNGRALASTGAVSLDSNPVNVPACP